jgi:hypothetical protein
MSAAFIEDVPVRSDLITGLDDSAGVAERQPNPAAPGSSS